MPAVDKKLSTKLVANIEEFEGGLNEAEKKLQRFERFVQNEQRKTAQAAEKTEFAAKLDPHAGALKELTGAAGAVSPQIEGMIGTFGGLTAETGGAAVAVGVLVGGFWALYEAGSRVVGELRSIWEEMAPVIVHTGNLARELDSTTESIAAFHLAGQEIGVDSGITDMALQRLERSLGQARRGSGSLAGAYKELGFSQKQVNDLAAGGGTAALRKTLGALHDLHDTALEASIGQEIFGRQFHELAPLVETGGAALDKATEAVLRHGSAFSAVDAHKVQEASAAVADLSDAWMGVKTQITIGMSPYVKDLAEGFEHIVEEVKDMGQEFAASMGDFGPEISDATDDMSAMVRAFEPLIPLAGALVDEFIQLASLATTLATVQLMAPLGLVPDSGADFQQELQRQHALDKRLAEEQRKHRDFMRPHHAGDIADSSEAEAAQKKMDEQVAAFGRTTRQAEIYKASLEGMSAATRKHLEDQDRDLTSLERVGTEVEKTTSIFEAHRMKLKELKDMQGPDWTRNAEFRGAAAQENEKFRKEVEAMEGHLYKSTRTPLEEYEGKLKDLNALKAQGLDQDIYNRAAGQDALDLLKSDSAHQIQAPRALEAGSAEAYSAILKATRPESGVQERIARILAQIEQHAALQQKISQEVRDAIRNSNLKIKAK